ncbi:HmuY family protein [Myxococcus sp. MxC21-1]|uniref:HmuY family protein n=1 Tax=Myxococcus sp. MxC21-1 TaxID=3041439 RepID=UPI0029311C52|nr:HmuY family protein [Myxococcus sp. MxC21-1]WNZ61430.1 HmuY family protein [Myxococcus sp. MxC21-1]
MKTHTEETMHTKASKQGLWVLAAVAMALALLVNCGSSDEDPTPVPDAGQTDSGTNPTPDSGTEPEPDAGTEPEPDAGTEPEPDSGTEPEADAGTEPLCQSDVPCSEQSIDRLNLLTTPSTTAMFEEEAPAGEFRSYIDARAGGLTVNQSYTYARFTPEGLSRVNIDDQTSLGDHGWDIAFRRYYIRLNGGTSGPSCIGVARLPTGTRFETVTSVPADLTFQSDAWYTETCEFIPDNSGLSGPTMALSSFWSYQGCVKMSGDVFIIRLADGRHVKFEVTSYYELAVQEHCNATNELPSGTPSGSGQLRVKWAFLP